MPGFFVSCRLASSIAIAYIPCGWVCGYNLNCTPHRAGLIFWLHIEGGMGKLKDIEVQAWVRAGKPIAGKSDGDGLTFTLSAKGTASWVFRYRLGGKQRELSIAI